MAAFVSIGHIPLGANVDNKLSEALQELHHILNRFHRHVEFTRGTNTLDYEYIKCVSVCTLASTENTEPQIPSLLDTLNKFHGRFWGTTVTTPGEKECTRRTYASRSKTECLAATALYSSFTRLTEQHAATLYGSLRGHTERQRIYSERTDFSHSRIAEDKNCDSGHVSKKNFHLASSIPSPLPTITTNTGSPKKVFAEANPVPSGDRVPKWSIKNDHRWRTPGACFQRADVFCYQL